ncbi:MAG: hypothetical protein ACR2QH_16745 [Geminicoccaceae bacterium]
MPSHRFELVARWIDDLANTVIKSRSDRDAGPSDLTGAIERNTIQAAQTVISSCSVEDLCKHVYPLPRVELLDDFDVMAARPLVLGQILKFMHRLRTMCDE